MDDWSAFLGKAAGAVTFIAFIPYVLGMVQGRNRPNRATWIIWTVVGFNLLISYRDLGATHTLWVSIGNFIAFFAVMILSFRFGEGGWSRFDKACLAGAAAGMVFLSFRRFPLLSLWMAIFVDFLGALPTLKKSHQKPESEDFSSWILFLAANTLNLFAIDEWNFSKASYPVYFFVISLVQVLVLVGARLSPKRID